MKMNYFPAIFAILIIAAGALFIYFATGELRYNPNADSPEFKQTEELNKKIADTEKEASRNKRISRDQIKKGNAEMVKNDVVASLSYILDHLGSVSSQSVTTDEAQYLECLKYSAYLFYLIDAKNEDNERSGVTSPDDMRKMLNFFSKVHDYLYELSENNSNETIPAAIVKGTDDIRSDKDAFVDKYMNFIQ